MTNKNKEGYPDPTAGKAIHSADKQPEHIDWLVRTIRSLADIMDCDIIFRIVVKGRKTGKIYH